MRNHCRTPQVNGGSRISQGWGGGGRGAAPEVGASTYYFAKFLPKNCTKIKEIGSETGCPNSVRTTFIISPQKQIRQLRAKHIELLLMDDPAHSTRKDQKPNRRKNEPV